MNTLMNLIRLALCLVGIAGIFGIIYAAIAISLAFLPGVLVLFIGLGGIERSLASLLK